MALETCQVSILQLPPQTVSVTTTTTAAQAAALSQAVAAMQSLAAGGVQHPLRSLQSPLIQARLAAGAASFVANNQLNSTNSLLVRYVMKFTLKLYKNCIMNTPIIIELCIINV